MARRIRTKKKKKIKHTDMVLMTTTIGFFLGIGLGALMNNVLLVTGLGLAAGAGVGYYIDRKNGAAYTRRKSRSTGK